MKMGVRRFVHVVFGPLLKAIGLDGFTPVARNFIPLESMTSFHIKKTIDLLTHVKNKNYNRVVPNPINKTKLQKIINTVIDQIIYDLPLG